MNKVGFIGAGAMAEAVISGIIKVKLLLPDQIIASDALPDRLSYLKKQYGIQTTAHNQQVLQADTVILAVKPQVAREVLQDLQGCWDHGQYLISIVTGISLSTLELMTSSSLPLVRVVPNTPCLIGEGASVLAYGPTVSADKRQTALDLFASVGKVLVLPESLLNAVTALSGSGPAYIFLLIEALSDAGVKVGLPRQVAAALAVQTVAGAAKMVAETGQHPAQLKDMVTSPGGTTIAGLHALEESKVRAGFYNAVQAAYERACQLGS